MSYPAGLKLNSNLSRFFGLMYHWLVRLWSGMVDHMLQQSSVVLIVLSLLSIGLGSSFLVAALVDLLRIITFHVRFCHFLSSRLFAWEVRVLRSLFYLFRGRKWNVLKERLESADYDLDQLLLGTVLFASLVFLFPTVATFYALFTISSLSLMALGCLGECMLIVAGRVPIYELLIRKRIAAEKGLRLETGRLVLCWKPPRLSATLGLTMNALERQVSMYFDLRRLGHRIITGRPLVIDAYEAKHRSYRPIHYSDYETIVNYYYHHHHI